MLMLLLHVLPGSGTAGFHGKAAVPTAAAAAGATATAAGAARAAAAASAAASPGAASVADSATTTAATAPAAAAAAAAAPAAAAAAEAAAAAAVTAAAAAADAPAATAAAAAEAGTASKPAASGAWMCLSILHSGRFNPWLVSSDFHAHPTSALPYVSSGSLLVFTHILVCIRLSICAHDRSVPLCLWLLLPTAPQLAKPLCVLQLMLLLCLSCVGQHVPQPLPPQQPQAPRPLQQATRPQLQPKPPQQQAHAQHQQQMKVLSMAMTWCCIPKLCVDNGYSADGTPNDSVLHTETMCNHASTTPKDHSR
jgi:hypothetical protein